MGRNRFSYTYDKPLRVTYSLGNHDYGAGDESLSIRVPDGATMAIIREISVSATETFNAVTTQGAVRVGTSGTVAKFAELPLGTLADTDSLGMADVDGVVASGYEDGIDLERDADGGGALSQLEVTLVAPVGGTPAGKGYTFIVIDWF